MCDKNSKFNQKSYAKVIVVINCVQNDQDIWRPSSPSELTPMIFNTGLTHLGSEASIC